MNKARAIKLKCLECSAESPKEVTLCLLVTCPLWPYRFGYSMRDKRYQNRIDAAAKNYPLEFEELMMVLRNQQKDSQNSSGNTQIHIVFEENKES